MLDTELFAEVKRLEIQAKHLINSYFSGEYLSAFKGRGVEFEEVRPYTPGDEVRTIDWNVSARLDQLFVKVYREERELSVFFLVDLSASQLFGSTETKRDLVSKLVALLSLVALRNNDKVGLMLCSDQPDKIIMPRKGRKHVSRLIRELLEYKPGKRHTNLALPLVTVTKLLKKRSIVFLVSDFKAAGYEKNLEIISRKHDVIPLWIKDNYEIDWPDNSLIELEDLESGHNCFIKIDQQFRERFKKLTEERAELLRKYFRKQSLDFLELKTGEAYLPKLQKLLLRRIRRRA